MFLFYFMVCAAYNVGNMICRTYFIFKRVEFLIPFNVSLSFPLQLVNFGPLEFFINVRNGQHLPDQDAATSRRPQCYRSRHSIMLVQYIPSSWNQKIILWSLQHSNSCYIHTMYKCSSYTIELRSGGCHSSSHF